MKQCIAFENLINKFAGYKFSGMTEECIIDKMNVIMISDVDMAKNRRDVNSYVSLYL